jgi:MFS family permease
VLAQDNGDGIQSFFLSNDRIFYLNIPVCILCFIGVAQFLNLRTHHVSFRFQIRRIDWFGIILFMVSTTSFLFGITVGGVVYDWHSFRTLLSLILGLCGLLAFGVFEAYIPKEPMFPLHIFKTRTAMASYVGVFFHALVRSLIIVLTRFSGI